MAGRPHWAGKSARSCRGDCSAASTCTRLVRSGVRDSSPALGGGEFAARSPKGDGGRLLRRWTIGLKAWRVGRGGGSRLRGMMVAGIARGQAQVAAGIGDHRRAGGLGESSSSKQRCAASNGWLNRWWWRGGRPNVATRTPRRRGRQGYSSAPTRASGWRATPRPANGVLLRTPVRRSDFAHGSGGANGVTLVAGLHVGEVLNSDPLAVYGTVGDKTTSCSFQRVAQRSAVAGRTGHGAVPQRTKSMRPTHASR